MNIEIIRFVYTSRNQLIATAYYISSKSVEKLANIRKASIQTIHIYHNYRVYL